MEDKIVQAANRLREAEASNTFCDPIRDLLGTTDILAAYQVQEYNATLRKKTGARVMGSKIGLTAPVVQNQLGVDQPDFGLLWDNCQIENGGSISVSKLMQPKAEAEVAFVLAKDLTQKELNEKDIIDAVDYAVASIEVVGSRIKNWDIKITDTIADNASASHWIIGDQKAKLEDLDLVNCKMKMYNKSALVSEGVGANCLGSPINAALWLAKQMVKMNNPLKAGDILLTGALGPMVNIKQGDSFTAVIEGLGSISIDFTV